MIRNLIFLQNKVYLVKEKGEILMFKKAPKYLSIILMTLLVLGTLTTLNMAYANGTVVRIDPSSLIDTDIEPGETITFTINVTDVVDLYTWQIRTFFNPDVLNCTSASYPADHIFAGKTTTPVAPIIDNSAGSILYGNSLSGPVAGVSGAGKLCQLAFKVKTRGSCNLTFQTVGAGSTFLLDSLGNDIPYTVVGAYFSNKLPPPPATLFVDPPRIVDPLLTPCNSFTVNVSIIEATDLYAFEFKLSYDPVVLNATSAVLGDFFPPGVIPVVTINNDEGYVMFSATLAPPEAARTGNGTLARITFHVENLGATALDLSDTQLFNQMAEPLPHSAEDGFFNNILMAKLAVDPPMIFDPSMSPPSTFDINITINEVEDLYSFQFNFTYNSEVLTCYGAILNSDFGGFHPNSTFTVDDRNGYIWVNASYDPPASPITTFAPRTLVTLKFQVESMGISHLNLTDTGLADSEGNPIPHEVTNGIFISQIRDVAIIDVYASTNMVYQGWPVNISVVVTNKGDVAETFDVTAYFDNMTIGTATIIGLAPNDTATAIIAWNTTAAAPCHNYTISAYAWPVPYEINLADNSFTDGKVKIKMMGDINGDGIIDYRDINQVAMAFGSTPASPRWNPDCDLNRDGVIDMKDMFVVAKRFGQTC